MTTYVSLGSFCLSASILKSLNIKFESYPFDWVFAYPITIKHCIENDFKDFLSHEYLVESESKLQCNHSHFFDSRSDIFFFQHHNPKKLKIIIILLDVLKDLDS